MGRRIPASRKIVNALLSVVLVLGLLPAPAFAGETGIANDTAGPAVTATQGGQGDSSAAHPDVTVIDTHDSNGGESLPEAGDASAPMKPDTTAEALDIDAASASDGASALSEGGASLTPGWTQLGTCEWKIDGDGLLTVRPLGDGASGELADWGHNYNSAPWCSQRESIKSVVIEPGVSAKTCFAMFYPCSKLSSLDLSGLDTSKVTDMDSMFAVCSSLSFLDLSGLDTSKVKDMDYMFSGCSSLESLDLSSFDTSKVTEMRYMFSGCSSLSTVYASNGFDVSAVTTSTDMFSGCSALVGGNGTVWSSDYTDKARARVDGYDGPGYFTAKDQTSSWKVYGTCEWMIDDAGLLTVRPLGDGASGELADWDNYENVPWYPQRKSIKSAVIEPGVSVRTCREMFYYCSSLTSLDLSGLDTSKVTYMGAMFCGCSKLTSLDLSPLDTSKVTDMDFMFSSCSKLTTLDLSSFDTSAVTDMGDMFCYCSSLTSLDLSGLDTSKVTDMTAMFKGCSKLATLDLSPLDTSKVTDMGYMFSGCKSLATLDLSPLDTSKVTDMGYMFSGCKSLATLDLSPLDTSAATDMTAMFRGCSSLATLDLTSFDTNSVTAMGCSKYYSYNGKLAESGGMFEGCDSLKALDLTSFDTSKVKDMTAMFRGCSSLESLDLSSFDTSAVTDMTAMFKGCSSLASLDLSSFDTGSVTAMGCSMYYSYNGGFAGSGGMFEGCDSLKALDLSPFDTSKVKDMDYMFYGCSSLESLDLSSFDTSKVTEMRYMFSGCSSLAAIYASLGFDTGAVRSGNSIGMFSGCSALSGGNGTAWSSGYTDKGRAGVDGYDGPGYFTLREGLTPGWKLCGTCEWMIDGDGQLTVRPLGDGVSGELADWDNYESVPWYPQRKSIRSAVIESGVSAKTCFAMFYGCTSLSSLDLSGLDTSAVTDMGCMFSGCSNLASANLSGLDFSTVKNMSKMFYGCASLKEIPAGFEMPANVPVSQCFYVNNPTEMRYTGTDAAITTYDWASDNRVLGPAAAEGWSRFGGVQWQVADGALTIAPLPGETGGEMGSLGVYAGAPWYAQRKDITSVKIEGDIKAGASLGYAFDGMANLASADLSNLDVSATTDMSCMFRGCSSLAAVDLSGWVTPSLENAYMAFSKCANLQSADLIGWDFSRMTDMRQMFAYCPMLISVPLGLTIPDGANASKLFYVESDEPVSIRYGGDDGSVRGYDWTSDNRVLSAGCTGEHSWDEGAVTKKPTCTEPGEKTLTCTACGATLVGSYIAPTGHAWGEPAIVFSEDGRSAVANWTCGNDAAHTETADCNVTSEVTKAATCTEVGETTYTAAAASEGMPSGTAQKTLADIPAKGHHFEGMVCADCGTHLGDVNGNGVVNVVDAQIAYDMAIGKGDYSDLPGYKAYRGAADVTGPGGAPDGVVDAVDAFRIQYAALHGWE